ncbi:MAG: lectin like domain-containing protein, partial [Methanoregulaceae archaeon]|nr:lectin like domain-containing protein [Methanoregulaceae archaeon]
VLNTPVSGSALSTQSGTIGIPGYHTITLSSPVKVKQGEKFSVVVKLTTLGNNYPVAIEYPYSGFSSAATSRSGESYVSNNGVSWTDLTTIYTNSNVCLKAFSSRPSQTNQMQQTPLITPTPAQSTADSTPPSVTISSPTSYATVSQGQSLSLSWSSSDNKGVGLVTLQYSSNGGSSWTTIADNQPQSGTYTWTIPNAAATSLSIKITARDTSGNVGSQTRTLFVRKVTVVPTVIPTPTPTPTPSSRADSIPPTVTISSPTSYASISPGQSLAITWSASDNKGVTSVALQYSSNGGGSWTTIADNQPKSGTYTWTIPNTATSSITLKVAARDASGNVGSQTRALFIKKTISLSTIATTTSYDSSFPSSSYSAQKESLMAELIRGQANSENK